MYEGVETTMQDYRPLQLERKIHERNLVINILRFHDVFLCVVPFQLGADTGSLRGGVDVGGGIGFNHEALANKNSRPSMLSTKMSIISANLATVSSCPPLVKYACSAVMKRSHVFNFFSALLQRNSDPFTCTYINSTVLILPWVSTGFPRHTAMSIQGGAPVVVFITGTKDTVA